MMMMIRGIPTPTLNRAALCQNTNSARQLPISRSHGLNSPCDAVDRRHVLGELAASAMAVIAVPPGTSGTAWASVSPAEDVQGLVSQSTAAAARGSTWTSTSNPLPAESRSPRDPMIARQRLKPPGRVPRTTLPCGLSLSKVGPGLIAF